MFAFDEIVTMVSKRNINFDTLKYANRLKAVGVLDKHAETQAELQAETIIQQTDAIYDFGNLIASNLVTGQDAKDLKNELKSDIKQLEFTTKRDLEESKNELRSDIKQLEFTTKRDLDESKNELKQEINELKLSIECANKNIVQMGYKTMTVLASASLGMTAALGFLIKTN